MTVTRTQETIEPPLATAGTVRRLRAHLSESDAARSYAPLVIAIAGLIIFGTLKSDEFLTLTNFQNIFQQVSVLGVLAVGATLLMVAGQLDLSVGGATALISVVAAKLLTDGSSEVVTVIVAVALGLSIGLLLGMIVTVTRVQPFVLTLGGLSAFSGIALIVSDQQPIAVGFAFSDLSLGKWGPVPLPAVVFIGLCVIASLVLRFTRLGRSAYAVGSNEEAAFLSGVSVGRTKIALYGLNGMLVGVAGIMLLARLGNGDPNAGAGFELQAITAVVLGGASLAGGRGSILGTFLGVFLLGLISNALNIAGVPNSWERVVFGGVLMIAVVWAALGALKQRSGLPLHRQLAIALQRRGRS
jgi:ribose/xylose/arabinose/galactoside ABC-type transport system permease subunit